MLDKIKKDFSTMTWVLIPVAIAINIAVGQIVVLLKLPVYLDSIGTVLVGIICGPWAGALTGAVVACSALHRPGGGVVCQRWPVQKLVEGDPLGFLHCTHRCDHIHTDRSLPVWRHHCQRFVIHYRVSASDRSGCCIRCAQHRLPRRTCGQDRDRHAGVCHCARLVQTVGGAFSAS